VQPTLEKVRNFGTELQKFPQRALKGRKIDWMDVQYGGEKVRTEMICALPDADETEASVPSMDARRSPVACDNSSSC
jgi:hypothetical protein